MLVTYQSNSFSIVNRNFSTSEVSWKPLSGPAASIDPAYGSTTSLYKTRRKHSLKKNGDKPATYIALGHVIRELGKQKMHSVMTSFTYCFRGIIDLSIFMQDKDENTKNSKNVKAYKYI